MKTDNEVTKK